MEGANELIELGRELARLGFTWASSGNLSMRTGEGFTMTASGSRLPRLGENDLVTVDANGEPIAGAADARPSKEAGMHLAVYRRVAEANCVIHLSPPFTTFLACSQLALPAHAFPEGMMHLRDAVRVPYRHAGSDELAQEVGQHCTGSQVLILENHGALVWAATSEEALLKLEVLEFGARLAVLGSATGSGLKLLGNEVVDEFVSSGYRR
ncbi:MAG TPA: class II aldolase/adducin family protein [Trueperaceae bacterium]